MSKPYQQNSVQQHNLLGINDSVCTPNQLWGLRPTKCGWCKKVT